ncbi:DUF397 domain-containing protein [Streptomyces sp. CRN 30]|uniref:DUF397 domain-containing protein n=1 Tax=Streptomyces sp. CRN 30 TaxID=3075613 RepID=UPI002A82B71C|nr:DUF397 domain-containing protein [Streptomyces sp. CRN 30]
MNTSELAWFKSSYSGSQGDDCIEVAESQSPAIVHVRDSKARQGSQLAVSPGAWTDFLSYAANT